MLRFFLLLAIFLFAIGENQSTIFSEINLNPTIKIVSPNNGQSTSTGNLTVLGVSTDNNLLNCTVQIDINNSRPYQNATATGPRGANDFSTWRYTTTDLYNPLEKGLNNITAKFVCDGDVLKTTKYTSITINNSNSTQVQEKIPRDLNSTTIENEVKLDNNKNNLSRNESLALAGINKILENNSMEKNDLENLTNSNLSVFNDTNPLTMANLTNFNSPIENMIKDVKNLIIKKENSTLFTINNNTSEPLSGDELVNFVGNFATSVALFNPDIILNSTFLSSLINADAGNDIVVKEGKIFTVDGSRSSNPDGGITSYIWQQIDDSKIKIIPENSAFWSIRAPEVDADTTLEFKLNVIGGKGGMDSDIVNVTILNDK